MVGIACYCIGEEAVVGRFDGGIVRKKNLGGAFLRVDGFGEREIVSKRFFDKSIVYIGARVDT